MSESAEDTRRTGEEIGKRLSKGDVVTLHGTLGAGKTTLVKGIAAALGINEDITSPSFTIISEYLGRLPLYHMDLYRIDSIEEFELIGPEEMLEGEGVSVIEWAEKAENFFPDSAVKVTLEITEDGKREITVEGAKW